MYVYVHACQYVCVCKLYSTHTLSVVEVCYSHVACVACVVQEVSIVQAWEGVHYFKSGQLAPCSSLGVCKSGGGGGGSVSLVTGGEDGRINVLRPENQKPIRVIGNG